MTSSTICVNNKLKVLECHISQAGEINLCTWSIEITDDARWPEVWTNHSPRWGFNPCTSGHRWSLWPEVWRDQSDGSEINPLLTVTINWSDKRCERIVLIGGELIPAWCHRWSLWPEVRRDRWNGSGINPLLGSRLREVARGVNVSPISQVGD